jgi:hypothetical protein
LAAGNSDDDLGAGVQAKDMLRLLAVGVILLLGSCTTPPTQTGAPPPALDATKSITPLPSSTSGATGEPASVLTTIGASLASAQGDFDCDGLTDRLQFFARPPGTPRDALIVARLSLGAGAVRETTLGSNDVVEPSPLIGITDVNGDGCDDAIVVVGRGASTTWTSFLVYDNDALGRVEEDGKPVTFLFGGSVRHGNAIECRTRKDDPEIVARGVSDYTSNAQWDAVEDIHRWSTKSRLVLWSTTRSVILVNVPDAMPNDQERYWGLSCGNVKLSG